jgi:hypothetical protein
MPLTLTRSLLVVIVPGIVAIAPWLFWAIREWPDVKHLYSSFPVPFNAFALAIVIVTGSVFEGLGSVLEARWDNEREADHQVKENWHGYLARVCKHEPVGFRYLSGLATSFYFELAMILASLSFFLGLAFLCLVSGLQQGRVFGVIFVIIALGSAWYFRWQARCSHQVLCATRQELNRRMSDYVEQGDEADEAG